MLSHGFPPIIGGQPRLLILGSMPGMMSLKKQQYYGHPRNAFWAIMATIVNIDLSLPYAARCTALIAHHIAVFDVLKTCHRKGSLDQHIDTTSIKINDFRSLLQRYTSISHLFFNAIEQTPNMQRLPSTSPAYARMSFAQKQSRWAHALAIALA